MPPSQPQFTKQQQLAIQTRNVSLAISAGAGCGKTTVLTERFLANLQPGNTEDPLAGIVAITFTDRAAREMRNRIRTACYSRLHECDATEVDYWLKIIRGLDSARISTIHSFCSSLIRANAVAAGIDPKFNLLEEMVGNSLRRRIVKDVIFELLENQSSECMELVFQYGLESTIELMQQLLPGRFEINPELFNELDKVQLAKQWKDSWNTNYVSDLSRHVASCSSTLELMRILRANTPDHQEMQRRRAVLLNGIPNISNDKERLLLLNEILECAKVQGGGSAKVWSSPEIYQAIKNLLTELRSQLKTIIAAYEIDEELFENSTHLALAASHVLEEIARKYQAEKRQQSLLDFDDLLLMTCNLLRDSPAVCKRTAAGIDFLMVDEFQDTDPVQAGIVRLLCGSELMTGKLFLVGDVKQSIYRFRRADPKVFLSLREELPQQGRLPLSTNFRSQPEVLHFVNCIFSQSMGADYEPLVPGDSHQYSPMPAIEFLFATPDENPQQGRLQADDLRKCEADWIAKRIRQLLDDETPRIRTKNSDTGQLELRRVEPGDIVILFRGLSQIAIYEHALKSSELNYYLVGGHAFFAQQEIYDFVNLCRFLDDPDDVVSLAGILRSPWFGLTDDTLLSLLRGGEPLSKSLFGICPADLQEQQQLQVMRASQVLTELQEKKDSIPIAELLELALERTGYDASLLLEYLGHRKLANLRKLIEMARTFDQSGQFSLKDFAVRMQESISEETKEALAATHPETSNVIRMMSIHQSKGLEFPVVIIADMNPRGGNKSAQPKLHTSWGPLFSMPTKNGVKQVNPALQMHQFYENQGDDAESIRILYVAMTRAADYLILSAGFMPDKRISSSWMQLISRMFDIETGKPVINTVSGQLNIGEFPPDQIPKIFIHQHAPQVVTPASKQNGKPVSVSQIRHLVNEADATPVPQTVLRLSADRGQRSLFSVTELMTADFQLQFKRGEQFSGKSTNSNLESLDINPSRLGTFIHQIIEQMDFNNPLPLETIIDQEMKRSDISEHIFREISHKRLINFYNSSLFAEMSQAENCYREIDFRFQWCMPDSSELIIITGQIDALFLDQNGDWNLVDFKTGQMASGNPDLAMQHYEMQLAIYMMAFEEMHGHRPENVRLILLNDTIRPLEFHMTESKQIEIQQRMNAAINLLRD